MKLILESKALKQKLLKKWLNIQTPHDSSKAKRKMIVGDMKTKRRKTAYNQQASSYISYISVFVIAGCFAFYYLV